MKTTKQAATILGVSERRVRALIDSNQLPALKVGRDWIIEETDLQAFKEKERPAHRPKTQQ